MTSTATQTATSLQISAEAIEQQIADLDSHVTALDARAADLSLDAVSGNRDAIDLLANINSQMANARADRVVLGRARETAKQNEAKAYAAAAAAERARRKASARAHANALGHAAERIDRLIVEFDTLLATMRGEEAAIWTDLAAAGEPANDGIIGRRGIDGVVLAHLSNRFGPSHLYEPGRGAAFWANAAWGYLSIVSDEPGQVTQ